MLIEVRNSRTSFALLRSMNEFVARVELRGRRRILHLLQGFFGTFLPSADNVLGA
jgi:hypothetical protein